ncbi:MAG TPA: IS4 family transposase [Jatrophihabitantaceae bacterium]|nr:IS4 family transposase [Jatrophihabitantaceae bacterium]
MTGAFRSAEGGGFGSTFRAVSDTSGVTLPDRIGVGVLTRLIPRDLVDDVLVEVGRVEQRRRLLPARVVVYYVLALCLFFGDAYEEVMRKLVGGLQWLHSWDTRWDVPTASALCQARQRLGEEPLRALFDRVAAPMLEAGTGPGWCGPWRVMAIDGVILDMPDTVENVEQFGRSGNHLADSPFPQARVVMLAECGTRAVVSAEIGGCHDGERDLAWGFLDRIDDQMLVLADRGFYSYEFWQQVRATGAQTLWRVKTQIVLPVQKRLPDGSYLSALVPKSMRSAVAGGKARRLDRYEIPVRVIDYTITNRSTDSQPDAEPETIRLVTSILDHELAPAAELAALYHQRWEIELALDEIQTHQMGRPRVLRSRSPQMVKQEIWALLLSHYAIRHLIYEAADQTDSDPDRVSFMRTLRIVRRQVTDQAAFSPRQTQRRDQNDDR